MESKNKCSPTTTLTNALSKLRENLRVHLSQKFDFHLRRLKLNHYANAKRAGKYLAGRLKAACTKTRIAHLVHPTQNVKTTNPQDIANQFAKYYGALYNLHTDDSTPQPSTEKIQEFLQKLKLPSLSSTDLTNLNAPFTTTEITKTIDTLPNREISRP